MVVQERRNHKTSMWIWMWCWGALYAAIRVKLANYSPIMDCDEVYNYWEPLHFLQFGTGMQTWEYSPDYALRTYAYLLPLKTLSYIFHQYLIPQHDKVQLFRALRSTLAFVSAISEWNFISAVKQACVGDTWIWLTILLLTASGMFHATAAFLPSATVMILWMQSASHQLTHNYHKAIVYGLLAVLAVGWPFCAVLFIPLGLTSIHYHYTTAAAAAAINTADSTTGSAAKAVMTHLMQTLLSLILIQIIVSIIDAQQYQDWSVFPTWNIFVYNTAGGGDELYGVEPLSYYIKNILLNFHGIIGILSILSYPLLVLLQQNLVSRENQQSPLSPHDVLLLLLPMYLWLALVLPRPHKEERFLFPIYPMMGIAFATLFQHILHLLELDNDDDDNHIDNMNNNKNNKKKNQRWKVALAIICLGPSILLSISRSMALSDGYTAPIALYSHLYYYHHHLHHLHHHHQQQQQSLQGYVCTCGEWYRFPSSFLLPETLQLGYLKSSFTGQLPQPFTSYGSSKASLQHQKGKFNPFNQEEMDRYISLQQCDYIVEYIPPTTTATTATTTPIMTSELPECIQYMQQQEPNQWQSIQQYPFLDAQSSSTLHRAFYIPWLRKPGINVHYGSYTLFERRK